jgi:hypothetical protein
MKLTLTSGGGGTGGTSVGGSFGRVFGFMFNLSKIWSNWLALSGYTYKVIGRYPQ